MSCLMDNHPECQGVRRGNRDTQGNKDSMSSAESVEKETQALATAISTIINLLEQANSHSIIKLLLQYSTPLLHFVDSHHCLNCRAQFLHFIKSTEPNRLANKVIAWVTGRGTGQTSTSRRLRSLRNALFVSYIPRSLIYAPDSSKHAASC